MKRRKYVKTSLPWLLAVISLAILLLAAWIESKGSFALSFRTLMTTIGISLLVASLTSALLPYVLASSKKEELIQQLKLFYPPRLVDEISKQIFNLDTVRDSSLCTLRLKESFSPEGSSLEVFVTYEYDLSTVSAVPSSSWIVYRLPNNLLEGSRILGAEAYILSGKKKLIEVGEMAVHSYSEASARGLFFRVPITLQPSESVHTSVSGIEKHPLKSEILLVSYLPSLTFKVRIEIPDELAKKLSFRAEYYHPTKAADHSPTSTGTLASGEGIFLEYVIDSPCLPYEGVRVSWDTQEGLDNPRSH